MSKNEEYKTVTEKHSNESIFGKISFFMFILPCLLVIGLSIFGEIISIILILIFNLSNLNGYDMSIMALGIQLSVTTILIEFSIYFCPLGVILALIGLYNTPRKFAVYGLFGNIFLFYISNK